jgi:hypothetical protein
MRTFIPFHKIEDREVVVVDGMHAKGLILSHWKGANTHTSIAADTSAAVVINAIKENFPGIDIPLVTATHFDIDGFIGVWSLFNPALALQYEDVLKEVAKIGDFRELDLSLPYADHALKLTCWIDSTERKKFYRPFGAEEAGGGEIELCGEKFDYFLGAFGDVLLNTEKYKSEWQNDHDEVMDGYRKIRSERTKIEMISSIGLSIIETPSPVHYYALFSATEGSDIVLSIYDNNRYELEYKYTTWVDIISRPALPRINMEPLAAKLNAEERSGYKWYCDKISDTGPLLRLENSDISRADRFANPTQRNIFSSSISPAEIKRTVISFFEDAYKNISPKKNWSWKEIRSINNETISQENNNGH